MLEWMLVPVDIGEHDTRSIEVARQFAAREGARIALVYVEGQFASSQEKVRDTLTLRRLAEPLWDEDVEAYYSVEVGRPAAMIADVAAELRPDIVIMAPPAHQGIERLLHRSVTLATFSKSPAPVLVWPPQAPVERAATFLVNAESRIVVPLDGSELAEGALSIALSFARQYHRPLLLVRAVSPRVTREPAVAHKPRGERDEEAEAIRYITGVRDRLAAQGHGIQVEYSIVYGKPQDAIVQMASEADPGNLVVMSTHGRTGADRVLVGSVAADVVGRASIPVIVVPPLANTGWSDIVIERHAPAVSPEASPEASPKAPSSELGERAP